MNCLPVVLPLVLATASPVALAGSDTVLNYEIPRLEQLTEQDMETDLRKAVAIFRARLRGLGLNDAVVRGRTDQERPVVEVILPDSSTEQVASARRVLQSQGRLEFLVAAQTEVSLDVGFERRQLEEHLTAIRAAGGAVDRNLDLSGLTENRTTPDGSAALRWASVAPTHAVDHCEYHDKTHEPGEIDFVLLEVPLDAGTHFTQRALKRVYAHNDPRGQHAIGFEMDSAFADRFGEFTEEHVGRYMAVVLDGEVLTLPVIQSRIPGTGVLSGGANGFTEQETRELAVQLRSGELPARPVLVSEKTR